MVLTLLKNHFNRSKPRMTNINKKNILGLLMLVVLTTLILFIFGYIIFLLTQTFVKLRLSDVYLKTVFFILFIVLTVYETLNIIKQLYQSKDNHIYLKLPVSKEKIFFSKVLYLYLSEVIISFVFLFITAGIYGLIDPDLGIEYYLKLILITFTIPFISLILASILSIPTFYIQSYIKKNRVLLIISLLLIIGVFFFIYIQFINVVLNFINLTSNSSTPVIDPNVIEQLRASTNGLFMSSMFYELLMGNSFLLELLYILLGITVLLIGVYFLLKYFYFQALNKENERIDLVIKKETKVHKPAMAVFLKELKTMTRNPDYAFQAIVLNLLMPIFIYLTINLTYKAGEATVGKEIVPGITLLTLLIFILLTNSFQGVMISREKQAHFITRIAPVNIMKQLFFKMAFGYTLNCLMILITTITITSFGYISLTEGNVLFVISLFFSTAYTFILVASDYKNPQLTSHIGGFEEGINMYKNLFVGLLISIVVGVLFSVTPYIRQLYEFTRVFQLLDIEWLVIMIDANTINIMLYGAVILIITIYLLTSVFYFRKVVKTS